ncbi:chromosome segregation in meiosis- protein [Ascochyta rabiei]|uniref:Chromosome segregation in meiosis protein n=1 Tax=Didymella rabiei TaxID=5454 RepID=A0A163JJS6_DIDRA|nr:chromosome segregation in meiosis- protein [Ascochyta rabiei]KZM26408.1 DNA repair [Ascochyta rabiei]UPX14323.1 chromosome segregation in meiosis- protein [Ascochyta rabiei]
MSLTHPPPTSGDELDDILNGIASEGGHVQSQAELSDSRTTNNNSNTDAGLGIDEEIVVTKKRIPIPKLDEARLRSEPGIPRLRKISKERLRFKGKGHEYGDIARMLNMYQLWLDDLYPRAKFADALAIIEKVGHTKRMQVDRKAWMDEGKPGRDTEQDEDDLVATVPDEAPARDQQEAMEDLDAGEDITQVRSGSAIHHQPQAQSDPIVEGPDEDELDALLAETTQADNPVTRPVPSQSEPTQDDIFADEMEAMEGMDDMW